jgi:1-acyl-sn-glycerol-3-phosphate acyltransferase
VLYTILRVLTFGAVRVLFRFRATGLERVPREGSLLLAANHRSYLDPPLVGAALTRQVHFLAKAELFRVPLLGGLIQRLNAHPVERAGSDGRALRLALSLLRQGAAILIFPEGTRRAGAGPARGKPGAGMLAALSGAPVVPVYIHGSERALPRGAVCPRPARITVTYGAPLTFPQGHGSKERYQDITDEILAAVERLDPDHAGGSPDRPGQPAANSHADRTARGPLPVGHQQE